MTQKIFITGANGLVGSALFSFLKERGFAVEALPRSFIYEPTPSRLEGCDVLIHLAGAGIADSRWTTKRKKILRESRIEPTRKLAAILASLKKPPKLFLVASGAGIYGDRGDEELTEKSKVGFGFLADLAHDWERASQMNSAHKNIRVVNMRLGMVLTREGGALAKMLPIFKLGLGGPLGNGRQWMSWIALADLMRAVEHIIQTSSITGPVNMVAPEPVRNTDFARELGRVLHRPSFCKAPALVLKAVMGEMASALLLSSQRVLPVKLLQTGFTFQHPALRDALNV